MKSQQSERREFSRTVVVDEKLHLVLRRPDVESVYSELETERIRCGDENGSLARFAGARRDAVSSIGTITHLQGASTK